MHALILAAALALAPAPPACAAAAPPPLVSGIVLISIDDLRSDHLGCYGYARATSPELDRFSLTATRFDRHFSASGWTLPSHMSIMTSMLPSAHGVVARTAERSTVDESGLPASISTLAEVLRRAGYQTAGFVAANNLRPSVGFGRGFDVYRLRHRAPAAAQTGAALAWLDARPNSRFFLFLHLYDVHSSIDDPRPGRRPFFGCAAPEGSRFQSSTVTVAADDLLDATVLPETQSRSLVAGYDGCILSADRRLGEFFAALRARGRFDSSLIVVTADHGENLGEWGYFSHRPTLNPALLRVPLIIKLPGQRAGAVRTDLTSSLDIMPTILTEAGAGIEAGMASQMGGLALMEGGARLRDRRAVFAEDTRRPVRAVIDDRDRELVEDLSVERAFLYDYQGLTRAGPFALGDLPEEAAGLGRILDEKYRDYPGN